MAAHDVLIMVGLIVQEVVDALELQPDTPALVVPLPLLVSGIMVLMVLVILVFALALVNLVTLVIVAAKVAFGIVVLLGSVAL